MSNKFEQLLDLLVNEEMDKANELFHEIVVEKSREIYENMIAEEAEDEYTEESDEDLEEDTTLEIGGDQADNMIDAVGDEEAMGGEMDMDPDAERDEFGGDDMGGEGTPEERIDDLEDALEELKAEFEALMADEENEPEHNDGEEDPAFGGDDDSEQDDSEEDDSEEDDGEEDEAMGYMEGRKMTREYVETVSDGHGLEKKGKGENADNTRSPVSSAKGRPTTGATAHNILGGGEGVGANTGTSPNGKTGGLGGNVKGQFTKGVEKNISGSSKSSFGNGSSLNKNGSGHGAERKGGAPGPVGSGSGDKAGQTSVGVVKSPLNGAPNRNA
jgi:hypothetical protein